MKRNIQYFLIVFFGVLIVYPVQAQKGKMEKAKKSYEHLDYVNAQEVYLKMAEKGHGSEEIYTKLANTYYFNAEYKEAVKWYEKTFAENSDPMGTMTYLRYSQSLRAMGKEEKAKEYYNLFLKKSGRSDETVIDYMDLIKQNSDRYKMKPLEKIYTEDQITYGHEVQDGELIYATTVDKVNTFVNKKDAWNGMSFLRLYEVPISKDNKITGESQQLRGALKGKFHSSSAVFTKDGKRVYFTRSNMEVKKGAESQNLKIYMAKKEGDEWKDAKPLGISSDDYSTAHPALSPDESKMYFASDMLGGHGQSDLYVVDINADGSVGNPENLGDKINTGGRETHPFVSDDNELYFSSDGHFGLGGLDVFYVKIKKDGSFGPLMNVGTPINSNADDFSFGINTETKYGFVSTDRPKNENSEAGSEEMDTDNFVKTNIYSFKETKPIKNVYKGEIEGIVTDKHSEEPIENATVKLLNKDGEEIAKTQTDADGHYDLKNDDRYQTYTVRVSHDEYDTDEALSEPGLAKQEIDFQLQRNIAALTPGTNLAEVLNIPIIHFDFDKSNIREDAQVQLEKVYTVLTENPDLKIQIRSHTDSRGSDAYNMKLSDRRAQSTRDYLIKLGIEASRLAAKGFGETKLVNGCSNGVDCTEEQHQANRRSEFMVQ